MAYTNTTRLGLKKAVIGSNQAFETQVFNDNLDDIDAEFVAVDGRLDAAEGDIGSLGAQVSAVAADVTDLQTLTTSGTVNAATTATTATTANTALKITANSISRTLSINATAPSSPSTGDIWIQV